jgi:hypothetical protein
MRLPTWSVRRMVVTISVASPFVQARNASSEVWAAARGSPSAAKATSIAPASACPTNLGLTNPGVTGLRVIMTTSPVRTACSRAYS